MRGSRDWDKNHPVHLLHASSVEDGICTRQVAVNHKSNEITAFPELLAQLDIQGAVITADVIHTKKTSVKVVTEKKAEYTFPVKKNQSSLLEDIKLLFTEADAVKFQGVDAAHTETLEKNGGRVEHRRYELLNRGTHLLHHKS